MERINHQDVNAQPVAPLWTERGIPPVLQLTDHLEGQSTPVDGATGTAVSTPKYWPFWASRGGTGTPRTDGQYTSRELDESTGFYFYGGRYHSSAAGLFLSADTMAPDRVNP